MTTIRSLLPRLPGPVKLIVPLAAVVAASACSSAASTSASAPASGPAAGGSAPASTAGTVITTHAAGRDVPDRWLGPRDLPVG